MSTRFEILKNGERICVSGIDGDGVLTVSLDYIKHAGEDPRHSLHIGGLGMFDPSEDRPHHAGWPPPDVAPGDEITIRILPAGEFDEPHGMMRSPKKTVDDPDFGQMDYYVDAWDAGIAFDAAPIERAHVHIRADESGPSRVQRDLIHDLKARHTQLWPDIRRAIVRCHPEITTSDELVERLIPHIRIDLIDDSDTLDITYRVNGDPEFRCYSITLRNWEIAEVYMAD